MKLLFIEMGTTKTTLYPDSIMTMSAYFKVLGHPARVQILMHLSEIDHCICGDLVEIIGLSQSTISQHLKELKNVGLIQGTVEGAKMCYCINQEAWNTMNRLILPFLQPISNHQSKCC